MNAIAPQGEPPAFEPRWIEVPEPTAGQGEILVEVRAAGLNRADLLQVRGQYPPPAGESAIPGLEVAGEVIALGSGVTRWHVGDRVAALLAGGGLAERVAVPEGQAFRVWAGSDWVEAAAVPEAGVTAWTNLVEEGALTAGQTVIVTGSTGGVGSFAVQLARALGANVVAVARRPAETEGELRKLGAALVVGGDAWPQAVLDFTEGRGADLCLDLVGGGEFVRGLGSLRVGGRVVLLGLLAGQSTPVDLAVVLRRRLTIVGSVLRPRSRPEKARLVGAFAAFALPLLERRSLRPLIASRFPFEQMTDAYSALLTGGGLGKVVVARP